MGRKYPGLLQVSLRPENLSIVLRAVRRNFFVNLAAASQFLHFHRIQILRVYGGGYVVVTC